MNVNFYLHVATAQKPIQIMLHVNHDKNKLVYSIGQKIHPKDWNKAKQRVKSSSNQASFLNTLLAKCEDEVLNCFRKCLIDSNQNYVQSIRNHLDIVIRGKKDATKIDDEDEFNSLYFIDYLDLMIEESIKGRRIQRNGKRIAPDTYRCYTALKSQLHKFEKRAKYRIKIVPITGMTALEQKKVRQHWIAWYGEFLEHLYALGLYDNGVGSVIKSFRVVWNYIRDVKCKDIGNFQLEFHAPKENVTVVALEPHHLKELIHNKEVYNSLPKHLQDSSRFFLFGCTIGLRIKDLLNLTIDNIEVKDDATYLINTSSKTNTDTRIKLPSYCTEIIDQFKNQSHNLLPMPCPHTFNKYIKEICKAYGFDEQFIKKREQRGIKTIVYKNAKTKEHYKLYEVITTHCMRRTAITSLLRLDVPERIVKTISGHSPNSRDFNRYVSISQTLNDTMTDNAFDKLI